MKDGKVVVVTGASGGFGRLMSETLARAGHRVFATMRDLHARNAQAAAGIAELAQRESLSLHTLELDVTDEDSVARAIEHATAAYGRIDVLVNNAGSAILDLAESVTTAQAQRLFDTNFFGVVRMNRAVLPVMKRQRSGLLLHVSSGAGRLAIPAMGLYCASKFAMEALAEAYRYELAPLGIDSVLLEPGAYPTPLMTKIERGEDHDRNIGYGDMAAVPERIHALLASSKANPQEIADSVLHIIETPPGQRQLRYRVSTNDLGVTRINALTDEVQARMLEAFGIAEATRFAQEGSNGQLSSWMTASPSALASRTAGQDILFIRATGFLSTLLPMPAPRS
ncbi:MAG TPA: SDR family oxidoreductase [Xanthomonadaceae bacterium]|nr:SDR family oxidoreductase [Xanthomonadaceae bacterium]